MWECGFDSEIEGPHSDEVLHGIFSYGIDAPSLVQKRVIPAIVNGWDVFFQSQSGTGTTHVLSPIRGFIMTPRLVNLLIRQERGTRDRRLATCDGCAVC